jgi:hypothetical protein
MAGLLKLLVLTNALAMALPLGWCCPRPLPADDFVAAETGGCPNCRGEGGPVRDQAPATPEKCPCCQVRATVAADHASAPAAPQAWVWLPPAFENPALAGRPGHPAELTPHPFPGPALHILHCVWRC